MAETNIIKAAFGAIRSTTTAPRYRYDYGQILELIGIPNLPDAFEAHFANEEEGTAVTVIGQAGRVPVPDKLFESGLPVYCWVYVHDAETDGRTIWKTKTPVRQRAAPEDGPVDPQQADVIAQAIAALNTAEQNSAANAAAAAESAEAATQSAAQSAHSAEDAAGSAEISGAAAASAQAFAQHAAELSETARGYAELAGQAAQAAEESAGSAEKSADRAEMAAANAGFFDVEIDARDHLIYTRTDEVDVDFSLDDAGHLIMEVD